MSPRSNSASEAMQLGRHRLRVREFIVGQNRVTAGRRHTSKRSPGDHPMKTSTLQPRDELRKAPLQPRMRVSYHHLPIALQFPQTFRPCTTRQCRTRRLPATYRAARQSEGEWPMTTTIIQNRTSLPRGMVLPTGALLLPATETSCTLTSFPSEEEEEARA